MGAQFTTLWQTPRYLESLERLARRQPRLKQRVKRVLEKYYENPELLDRRLIKNPRRRVFHTKLDHEKRLIDEPLDPDRPTELALLYVDHHDPANNWAEAYRGDTRAQVEKAARLTRRDEATSSATKSRRTRGRIALPTNALVHRNGQAAPDKSTAPSLHHAETFGECISGRELLNLGVPDRLVDKVRRHPVSTDLADIGLDEDLSDRVLSWYDSKVPLPPVRIRVPALAPPAAIPVTREELRTVLSLDLAKLVAVLSDEQRSLARRPNRNLYLVKGAAGSGKTVVGIRRIEYLLEQHKLFDKPILFVCYNKVLANAARQMIEDTIGQSTVAAGVEVWTAYELLASLQVELGVPRPKRRYVGPDRLQKLLAEARLLDTKGLLASWSDRALLDEILEVIYGRGLETLEEYRRTNRRGRGRALRREGQHRAAIWAVHERLRAICEKHGVVPWDELPVRVSRALAAKPPREPRYSALIIDEAQDLLPIVLRVLLQLQAGHDDNILLLGDAAQNVYRSGFRWGHIDLKVAPGQVYHLRRCYRSTPSIIAAAAPLIRSQKQRLEGDLVIPEENGDDGPPVEVALHADTDHEVKALAGGILDHIADGVPPSSIAVIADDRVMRERIRHALEEHGCRVEDFRKGRGERRIDIFDQSVKLLSIPSAKGIEFQVVYVPAVTEANFPVSGDDPEAADRARRALYTAMTRCTWELHVSAPEKVCSELLHELDSARVEFNPTLTREAKVVRAPGNG